MTIPRANPLGWAAFELLTSAQMNNLDIYNTQSLDGNAGGDYALAVVGGRGPGYLGLVGADSTGTTVDPLPSMRLTGGAYAQGTWTGAARSIEDLGHAMSNVGGASDDESTRIFWIGGSSPEVVYGVGSSGSGGFVTGGTSVTDGVRGGAGLMALGADGRNIVSDTDPGGGDGIQARGGHGYDGGGGAGIVGRGGDLEVGRTRLANSIAGPGGAFFGGQADANTNENFAGHGVQAGGADNFDTTQGVAGHGLSALGGVSGRTDNGEGNGNAVMGTARSNGASHGSYIAGSIDAVHGVGVYGRGPDAASGVSVGVVGVGDDAATAIGVFGRCNDVDATISYGIYGRIEDASAEGAAMFAEVQNAADAVAFLASIGPTPARGHLHLTPVTTFPVASADNLHDIIQGGAAHDYSLFTSRNRVSGYAWSRIVDEHTPWNVRVHAHIECDTGTETVTGGDGVSSAVVSATGLTVNLAPFNLNGAEYTVTATPNTEPAGASFIGHPVIEQKNVSSVLFHFYNAAGAQIVNLDTLHFAVEVQLAGAPSPISP